MNTTVDPKPGDRVRNPRCRDWGLGEVLATSAGGKLRVYFVHGGEKTLKGVPLEVVTGEEAAHPFLDHRKIDGPRRGLVRRTIPQGIEKFLGLFKAGFRDPAYFERERNYKVAAHELLSSSLDPGQFRTLLDQAEYEEICTRSLRVVNATNLIFPNEKMALRDGVASPEAKERFAVSLGDLLYGAAAVRDRFEHWCETLHAIEAPKWTIATYFQFLAFPNEFMFLKPTVTQDAADVCGFELNYRPELNWLTHRCVQEFSEYLRGEIASLEPRDLIDVQSFIWCIAPGKYDKSD